MSLFATLACLAAPLAVSTICLPAHSQSINGLKVSQSAALPVDAGGNSADANEVVESLVSPAPGSSAANAGDMGSSTDPEPLLPAAPEPAGNPQREGVPWTAEWHQQPFSRIGIGADISLLGIGIKAATPLDQYFDARLLLNFLGYSTGRIEVEGFNINANLHLASTGAMADVYPKNSIWRLSGGLMFFNGNQFSGSTAIVGGTSFSLGKTTYYSSTANPMTGSAVIGFHTVTPAPMASFGFGRFVPHSNRHWSFPAEFGVMYMGGPTLTVTTAGTVCTDKAQTQCSDLSDPTNPVAIEFNNSLQGKLTTWRKDLDKVKLYPIFSYSVVYSFNIR